MDSNVDATVNALLSGYPVRLALPVQWGDQDSFRHVNNAVYFRWYESGRIAYNRRIGIMTDDPAATVGPILAATSNNYRRQVAYPDTVHVGVRVVKIGRTSLAFEHVIVSEAHQAVAAEGTSTLVFFDYGKHQPECVPDAIRQAIASLEGKPFAEAGKP